jgi:acetyl esterase/lipase
MSTFDLLDPAIQPVLEFFPEFELTTDALPLIRQFAADSIVLADTDGTDARREEIEVPGVEVGQPPVRCLKYSPDSRKHSGGAYLHIHGGGYVLGSPEMMDEHNLKLAAELGITVLSVDYRLAPEHPVPAPLDDCYAALAWLHANSDALAVDPQRIALGGESAGGGLAAALALRARDAGEYPVCYQLLTYPMLDDRTGSAEFPADPVTGEFVWTREKNSFGWGCYLGGANTEAPSVPARAASLEALPPAWIGTAALDLFREENIDYAQRLMAAGVAAELIVYPGACHGFQRAVDAPVSRQFLRDHMEALKRGLNIV